ncbi:abortive infection system antitoxin AbiGi family protein [Chryseobacterium sp. JV558]|uniref:abortive infection system antitoxin AbiGi family protein n=1 Tax=Chryseobacterium sp. JV558 TaxID=2663236 RepID=UPI00299E09D6|nr:abortive infection system antitoxin AbiGi family protein [Chryseobacterium sp. JV558]MDW9380250.1 hypothetical protein [Chryseobacterium sp. JV558]
MAISSNSIIHYTNKLENIKGILENLGFRLKYCSEGLIINNTPTPLAVPMVCFCDIPLSEVKNHMDSYGSYGIGFYKSWAKDKGLNPVLYIEGKSETSKNLEAVIKKLAKDQRENKMDQELATTIIRFIQFCKNYEGPLKTEKIDKTDYIFYNEREWRYVPSEESLKGANSILNIKDYNKDKSSWNEKLKNIYLKYAIEDILI